MVIIRNDKLSPDNTLITVLRSNISSKTWLMAGKTNSCRTKLVIHTLPSDLMPSKWREVLSWRIMRTRSKQVKWECLTSCKIFWSRESQPVQKRQPFSILLREDAGEFQVWLRILTSNINRANWMLKTILLSLRTKPIVRWSLLMTPKEMIRFQCHKLDTDQIMQFRPLIKLLHHASLNSFIDTSNLRMLIDS